MSRENIETHVNKPVMSMFSGEQEHRLLSVVDETELDRLIEDVETYMRVNDGVDQSDEVKDQLYGTAISKFREYSGTLREVKFSFYLNRKQYQFLTDLLLKKLEYTMDTVFIAIELTNMLGTWKSNLAHEDDKTFRTYEATSSEVTYMYHLISKYVNKGLDANAYTFADVLRKIGDISKIINYYDGNVKSISGEIQKWAAAFEPEGVLLESELEVIGEE